MSYKHFCNDVIKTFFKTKTKTLKFFQESFKTKTKPSVQDQHQDFASQDQDQDLFRLDALAKASSVIATATWLGGWLGVRHTPVLYQNG